MAKRTRIKATKMWAHVAGQHPILAGSIESVEEQILRVKCGCKPRYAMVIDCNDYRDYLALLKLAKGKVRRGKA